MGSISGSGRSSGEGNGNPLQYSYLENPMYRGAWQVAKSQTWLKWQHADTHISQYTDILWFVWNLLLCSQSNLQWIFVYKFFVWTCNFSFLGCIPSRVNSMPDCLINCQTMFQSSYTILYAHQQCIKVLILPHHH